MLESDSLDFDLEDRGFGVDRVGVRRGPYIGEGTVKSPEGEAAGVEGLV